MNATEIKTKWQNHAHKKLVSKTIMRVRYMDDEEMEVMGWYKRPIVIELSDNSLLIPQMDDEGNDGGAIMYYKNDEDSIIPTL